MDDRVCALLDTAATQEPTGSADGAAFTLSEALAATRLVEGEFNRVRTLKDIGIVLQMGADDTEGGLATARNIERTGWRADTLCAIAPEQAEWAHQR